MKRFVFTRLYERDHDYNFYVPPSYRIGGIRQLIYSDTLDNRSKLFLLEKNGDQITFGVRERLNLRDMRGRHIYHFTGFQLDPNESAECIPSFTALKEAVPLITAEAHTLHEILDQDVEQGRHLQTSTLLFGSLPLQEENPWDDAVRNIRGDTKSVLLMMFTEDGALQSLGHGQANIDSSPLSPQQQRSPGKKANDAPGGNGSFAQHVDKGGSRVRPDFANKAGIRSEDVRLEEHERAYVPPLNLHDSRKSILDSFADGIFGFWNRLRGRDRNDYNF